MSTDQRNSDLVRLKQARQEIAAIKNLDTKIGQLRGAMQEVKKKANNVPPVNYHPVDQRQTLEKQYSKQFSQKSFRTGMIISTVFSLLSLAIFIWSCKVLFPEVNADAEAGPLRVVFKIIHILLGVILIGINPFFGACAATEKQDQKEAKKKV